MDLAQQSLNSDSDQNQIIIQGKKLNKDNNICDNLIDLSTNNLMHLP